MVFIKSADQQWRSGGFNRPLLMACLDHLSIDPAAKIGDDRV